MGKYDRAVRGAEAGAIAAGGVALSFFVLDLIRFQPVGTPGALSGAVFGPGGLEWDLTTMSGFLAGLVTAYKITTFTLLHFLTFALVGVFASLAFDWSHAPPGSIAYDIVTDPVTTDFLQNAEAAGFRTIDGISMLIGQAAAAFELFFGHPAPRAHDAELRALLTK